MKKLFFILAACCLLAVPAVASDVVVSGTQSTQIPFNPSSIGASRSITVTATSTSATVTSSAAFPAAIVGKSGFTVTIGGVYYTVAAVASTSSLTLTTAFTGSTGSATMVLFPYTLLRAYATAGFQSSTLTTSTATVSVTNNSQTVTSSAAFPSMYVGVAGGFQVLIGSVPYQVLYVASTSSLTLATAYAGSTGSATMTFDGIAENVQPSAPGSGNWYKEVAVSVVNTGSGNILYYPSFVLPATTNALINNQARFVLGFYRPDNSSLGFFGCGAITQLAIPTSTPTTLTAICNYNSPGGVVPPNTEVYTKSQIDQRLPSCTAGQGITFTTSGNVLSCGTAGVGSVTSVGLSLPASVFSVSGTPVTTSGTLTGSFATQTANTVFAGPTSGGAATPAFRALVAADIPTTGLTLTATQTSSNYTVLTTDWLVSVNATAASRTATLYAASGNSGKLVSVCKVDTTVNTVVISDGSTTLATIYAPEACVQLMSNGSAWKIQSY